MKLSGKWLVLLCAIFYLITASGHFYSTDEEDLFQNTELLFGAIQNTINLQVADSSVGERAPQEMGQSLLSLPWYGLGKVMTITIDPYLQPYLLRSLFTSFNIVITLFTIWTLFSWELAFGNSKSSWLLAGSYAFATFAWPYTKTYYREPLAALCILTAIRYAETFRFSQVRSDFLLSVALLILGIFTKTTTVLVIPGWMLCLTGDHLGSRKRISYGLALIVGLSAIGFLAGMSKQESLLHYLQELRFDLLNSSNTFIDYGLYGLLFSSGKGLFIYALPVTLTLIGWSHFLRRQPILARAILITSILFILFYSSRRGWHGGACWGPRYLLPILPLLMLPLHDVYEISTDLTYSTVYRKLIQGTAILLLVAGLITQVAAIFISPLNYYWEMAQRGFLNAEQFDGGPNYLEAIYFQPSLSPIAGHLALTQKRLSRLLNNRAPSKEFLLTEEANNAWQQFATFETLDFWWLYLNDIEVQP